MHIIRAIVRVSYGDLFRRYSSVNINDIYSWSFAILVMRGRDKNIFS